MDALFRQAGVIRTGTLEELFDVATLLSHQPVPLGRRVGILTNAGGPGILAADACEARGLELPLLSASAAAKLRAFLPPAASVGNPVDMLASATGEHYRKALKILLDEENFDSVLAIFIPPIASQAEAVATAIVEGTKGARKPVLATFMSAKGIPQVLSAIPSYPFPESAAIALARAADYGEWRRQPPGKVPALEGLQVESARGVIERALAGSGGWLGPREAEQLLTAFEIPVAAMRVARDETAAAVAAERPRVSGRGEGRRPDDPAQDGSGRREFESDRRGRGPLGLPRSEEPARRGPDRFPRPGRWCRAASRSSSASRRTRRSDRSSSTGAAGPSSTSSPTWRSASIPLTDRDVAAMLDEVKGTALLRGFRGAPRGDEAALKEMLLRVSALVENCPEVREMDLNPVKVLTSGVCVVDARIRVGRPPSVSPSRRIAY